VGNDLPPESSGHTKTSLVLATSEDCAVRIGLVLGSQILRVELSFEKRPLDGDRQDK